VTLWQWYVRRGRIDRRTWWLHYTLPLGLLYLLAVAADLALGNTTVPDLSGRTAVSPTWFVGPVVFLVAVLAVVPAVSANAARLHDRGMAAGWLLLVLVPYLGEAGLFVLLGFLRGDGGPNRYGPPPSGGPGPLPVDEPLYPPAHWT